MYVLLTIAACHFSLFGPSDPGPEPDVGWCPEFGCSCLSGDEAEAGTDCGDDHVLVDCSGCGRGYPEPDAQLYCGWLGYIEQECEGIRCEEDAEGVLQMVCEDHPNSGFYD